MAEFPPEQLDLDRLIDNLATRKLELAQYEAIAAKQTPGEGQIAWAGEVRRVREEIEELEGLIAVKKEHNRGI